MITLDKNIVKRYITITDKVFPHVFRQKPGAPAMREKTSAQAPSFFCALFCEKRVLEGSILPIYILTGSHAYNSNPTFSPGQKIIHKKRSK